jgi:hypothetical protein
LDSKEERQKRVGKAMDLILETMNMNGVLTVDMVSAFWNIMIRIFKEENIEYKEFRKLMRMEIDTMQDTWKEIK